MSTFAATREDTEAYKALKAAGHDAAKALEIVIDAERGDKYALRWIEGCKELVRK